MWKRKTKKGKPHQNQVGLMPMVLTSETNIIPNIEGHTFEFSVVVLGVGSSPLLIYTDISVLHINFLKICMYHYNQ